VQSVLFDYFYKFRNTCTRIIIGYEIRAKPSAYHDWTFLSRIYDTLCNPRIKGNNPLDELIITLKFHGRLTSITKDSRKGLVSQFLKLLPLFFGKQASKDFPNFHRLDLRIDVEEPVERVKKDRDNHSDTLDIMYRLGSVVRDLKKKKQVDQRLDDTKFGYHDRARKHLIFIFYLRDNEKSSPVDDVDDSDEERSESSDAWEEGSEEDGLGEEGQEGVEGLEEEEEDELEGENGSGEEDAAEGENTDE